MSHAVRSSTLSDDLLARVWDDRYEPIRVLGQGAQGSVVLARDRVQNRSVAIKLRSVDDSDRDAVLREARLLLAVPPHRNIAMVRADFFDGGFHGLVMDYVDGPTLRDVRADGIGWLCDVARAIDHLHSQQPPVVHGDVKPSNVVIDENHQRAVLVDFGMATVDSRRPGGFGTKGYVAPEVRSSAPEPASDIYSLAATAFTLLTGEGIGGDASRLAPDVKELLSRGLSTDPAKRPATAVALATELSAMLGLKEPKTRRAPIRAIAGGVVVVAVALLSAFLFFNDDPAPPRRALELVRPATTVTTLASVPTTATPATTLVNGAAPSPAAQLVSTRFGLLGGDPSIQVVSVAGDRPSEVVASLAHDQTGWTQVARIRPGQLLLYREADGQNRLVDIAESGEIHLGGSNPEMRSSMTHVVGMGDGNVFFLRQSDGYASTQRYSELSRLVDQDGFAASELAGYDVVTAVQGAAVLYRSSDGSARVVRVGAEGQLVVGRVQRTTAGWQLLAPLSSDTLLGLTPSGDATVVRVDGDSLVSGTHHRFAGNWTDAARSRAGAVLYDRTTGRGVALSLGPNGPTETARFGLAANRTLAPVG